jgi:hypothetical protein
MPLKIRKTAYLGKKLKRNQLKSTLTLIFAKYCNLLNSESTVPRTENQFEAISIENKHF